eukprot:TRINITY_DN3694_c0_g1_i1.p1 TRINITY_DN3694_c0_g1~~TRINITY_DN3694_c0_g1_i1.p1  ORF type:complete len:141 (-),score=35.00 TRINITY_DN3694_c0_g1_i1:456-878(-)
MRTNPAIINKSVPDLALTVESGKQYCAGCGKQLSEGEKAITALNGYWHHKCFVCCMCKKTFDEDKFLLKEGRPYHEGCAKEAFGKKCAGCGKVLEGKCVSVEGKVYHANCFVCEKCKKELLQGFVEVGGKKLCENCGKKR